MQFQLGILPWITQGAPPGICRTTKRAECLSAALGILESKNER